MVDLNLTSKIVLNRVSKEFYQPKTAVDRIELTRMEKVNTDIFASIEDGAKHIADGIERALKAKQEEGKFLTVALGTGTSLTPIYEELVRRHKENGLSFKSMVVFNGYEYFPLSKGSKISSLAQLKQRFLDQVDVEPQNVFSLDGTISQEADRKSVV